MRHVFLLQHSYEQNECDEIKTIGIYTSEEIANAVIEKFKILPGFKDYPENFHIDKYEVDADNWEEGFVKWEE